MSGLAPDFMFNRVHMAVLSAARLSRRFRRAAFDQRRVNSGHLPRARLSGLQGSHVVTYVDEQGRADPAAPALTSRRKAKIC
jgi:hypothetical protein